MENKNILKKQSKDLRRSFVETIGSIIETIPEQSVVSIPFASVFSQHLLFQNGVYKTNHRNLPKMVHKTWFRAKGTRNYLHRFSIVFLSKTVVGEPELFLKQESF